MKPCYYIWTGVAMIIVGVIIWLYGDKLANAI